ncbi:MarR family winged helix-turn-helix transcriptional regulator [Aureimonas populi]|uniref:MarR family winged helix-turn-helix transcriptional regulator n=1 Tax=Aureimonas populi TaxID=1701758 RepID=A0ABW5CH20_9HYPH|nr:MarR family winged helix-turn-helix transcriptional regulator [Aureimonas populi]
MRDRDGDNGAERAQEEAEPGEAVELGILAGHLGFHLRLANDRTFETFADLLGADRLRPGCFTMLILIANNPGITQTGISRACGRDKSSVAKALRYMEDEGLIRRERVEDDRRSSASFVTPAGAQRVERLQEKARIQSARISAALGEARVQELLATLKALIDRLS